MTPIAKYAWTFTLASALAWLEKHYHVDSEAINNAMPLAGGLIGLALLHAHRPGSPNAGLEPKK